jgi:hypothetical protein
MSLVFLLFLSGIFTLVLGLLHVFRPLMLAALHLLVAMR